MRALLPVLLLAGCQEFTIDKVEPDPVEPVDSDLPAFSVCGFDLSPRDVELINPCPPYSLGSFTPWVEWHGAIGRNATSLPVVADLDGDTYPEVILNTLDGGLIPDRKGELWVLAGDGSGVVWRDRAADLGYGNAPAVGDIDRDGDLEIVAIRALGVPFGASTYEAVAWDHLGTEIWQSATYTNLDFDYATAPVIVDMDGDGNVELVFGRVILNADGSERGRGTYGRGAWGGTGDDVLSEAGIPAVADLDLDGVHEVIVGNAMYSPDGDVLWHDNRRIDGMISVANLDDDPEGEFIACSGAGIRAHDTDGSLIWGPIEFDGANITAPAAIADLDDDGWPEIVTAGGNELVVFNHDGTEAWSTPVQDQTGATGASIFDFDGDGDQEVVYIDEIRMYAFNGRTGVTVFQTDAHASTTMMDYPVIADVDLDGSAEILVAHTGYRPPNEPAVAALTVYGAGDGVWAPTRPIWNQHAYAIDGVDDDGNIPLAPEQGFTTHNTWHAATDSSLFSVDGEPELQSLILDVCETECALGRVFVAVQPLNRTATEIDAGIPVSLYATISGQLFHLATQYTTEPMQPGSAGESMVFEITAEEASRAGGLAVVVDDDGTGDPNNPFEAGATGLVDECSEADNVFTVRGPFCE
jgi:hypothetical protein